MKILAATDFSTRSTRALRQAGWLARSLGVELILLHITDDDQPDDLVELDKREAKRILKEQMAALPELQAVECGFMVLTGDPFDGILRAASALEAGLIVMGTHRKQLLRDIVVGTTVERVIRTGPFPVLMVNNEAQRRYENVLAAVDMSEPSANALRVAAGLLGDTRGTLLHAFSPRSKGEMFIADADQLSIDRHVENERRSTIDELARFLVSNGLDRTRWTLRAEEGGAAQVISRVVAEMHADLLIMGTHGRSGLLKALIGSVTEQALRTLNVDILAVPPG
jgi:nucleotide-binding universal stress UspA family protein